MKNWSEMTIDEQVDIVKAFCKLHDSGDYTVRDIAEWLDISHTTAGQLATLLHYYSGYDVKVETFKKRHVSQKRRRHPVFRMSSSFSRYLHLLL
jgi:hypothetical protein